MSARIVVDESLSAVTRAAVTDVVRAGLDGWAEMDTVLAVVTRLPSGRLTVFINLLDDPLVIGAIEAKLANLAR